MVAAMRGRLRQGWRAVIRQGFWVLVSLGGLAGVVGDALARGWGSSVVPFLFFWVAVDPHWRVGSSIVLRLAWWVWWRLPIWQVERRYRVNDAKTRADVEDNFRKTIGQAVGGAAVLIGAGFAYLQFIGQQQAAHDLLISNQVAKGFELLGNKDGQIEQRLGGIYALEGVMNDSEPYRQPVLEALCAFVRNETQPQLAESVTGKVLEALVKTPGAGATQHQLQDPVTDVQAALTVIGRRNPGPGRVDSHGAHGARLSDAELFGVDLSIKFGLGGK
jgi:hypothetical protein